MRLPKHWHEIFQNQSNWADCVSYITQCPLRQREEFEYKFAIVGQSEPF